jgi:hypothetical protein
MHVPSGPASHTCCLSEGKNLESFHSTPEKKPGMVLQRRCFTGSEIKVLGVNRSVLLRGFECSDVIGISTSQDETPGKWETLFQWGRPDIGGGIWDRGVLVVLSGRRCLLDTATHAHDMQLCCACRRCSVSNHRTATHR